MNGLTPAQLAMYDQSAATIREMFSSEDIDLGDAMTKKIVSATMAVIGSMTMAHWLSEDYKAELSKISSSDSEAEVKIKRIPVSLNLPQNPTEAEEKFHEMMSIYPAVALALGISPTEFFAN